MSESATSTPNLANEDAPFISSGDEPHHSPIRRKKQILICATFCFILLCSSAILSFFYTRTSHRPSRPETPKRVLTNGTHEFHPTVLLISFDGFRNDYLDRNLTHNLNTFGIEGVRADYMVSVFPSATFVNHYSIATGLYPENHGIIGNVFYDPDFDAEFSYKKPSALESRWWGGEPIWVTAEKQDQISATMMWPGSEVEIKEVRPTYWESYDDNMPMMDKLPRIMEWLDLPLEKRPTLMTLYVPETDHQGHKFGPDSQEVNDAVSQCDKLIGELENQLKLRNLTDIVNIIVVSDHGMTNSSNLKRVFLDDFIDYDNIGELEGAPLGSIFPKNPEETDMIYEKLKIASVNEPFEVYLKEEIPSRYHFQFNYRIPPIVAVPHLGWIMMTRHDNWTVPLGFHGYDPYYEEMHAIFLAKGPDIRQSNGTSIPPFRNVNIYNIISHILDLNPAPNNGTIGVLHDIVQDFF